MVLKSGKWYWEVVANSVAGVPVGVGDANFDFTDAGNIAATTGGLNAIGYGPSGYIFQSGTGSHIGDPAAFGTSDIAAIAVDVDGGTVKFYKNNNLEYTYTYGTSGIGITPNGNGLVPLVSGSALTSTLNFGQNGTFSGVRTAQGNTDGNGIGDFYYAPPSGFLALCTANLPDPAIALPSAQFNTVLYTGTGATPQTVTGVGFQPDFVWIKNRPTNATNYVMYDAVRGTNKTVASSTTNAESSDDTAGFSAFTSDGFTLRSLTTAQGTQNTLNQAHVSWNWKANGSGSQNTDGTINSTATSANQAAGFSIVTYTGNGSSNVSVGHGLNVAPDVVIIKSRASVRNWWVYTTAIDGSFDYLSLNTTAAKSNSTLTAPTSTLFYQSEADASVAYCFASKPGFSKIGVYTGTGSATAGPFVNCGFKPAWVVTKNTSAARAWLQSDNKRSPSNVVDKTLSLDQNAAEDTYAWADFLSNGFKIRNTSASVNTDGNVYLYMAFAESPFKTANAR